MAMILPSTGAANQQWMGYEQNYVAPNILHLHCSEERRKREPMGV